MRVFQSTYKDRNGQTRKTQRWYIELFDHQETRRRIPGLRDKKTTETIGRNIERLVKYKASNEPLDPVLTKWVENLNPKMRASLAKIGLLSAGKIAALRPLIEHIDGAPDAPGWRQYLMAKGNTKKHVDLFCGRVRRALEGCKAVYWSDLKATRLMDWLNGQREDEVNDKGKVTKRGLGAYAFNGYVTALGGFGRWMVREGLATENPMLGLQKLNTRTDSRHQRRALSVDEIRWLLDTTRNGVGRYGMTGQERAMLYRLALETGLRLNELRSLTRSSFHLAGDNPTVKVDAAYSKHRREDKLPLRADTARDLQDFFAVKMPAAMAFNVPKRRHNSIAMWKDDLEAARQAWIKDAQSPQEIAKRKDTTFLSYKDRSDRYADFHALRHTCGSLLAASGAHPKVAQSIMRHSSIELTMSRYSHVYAGQESDAVAALPDLDVTPTKQKAKATGTDDSVLSVRLAHQGEKRRTLANRGEQKTRKSDVEQTRMNIDDNQCSRAFFKKPAEGIEPATAALQKRCSKSVSNTDSTPCNCDADCLGRVLGAFPADLQAVIDAWPAIPEHIKRAIVALIETP